MGWNHIPGMGAVALAFALTACDVPTPLAAKGPELAPSNYFPIELGEPRLQYGEALTIPFRVTNSTGSDAGSVSVTCDLRDDGGKLLQTGKQFVPGLAAGATASDNIIFMEKRRVNISCAATRDF